MAPVNWQHHEMQSLSVRLIGSTAILVLAALLPLKPAIAQTNSSRRTVWDGVYTEAQAARGLTAFAPSCSGCHALTPEGKSPLVGDAFWKSFAQKNVGDVIEFVSANMPNGSPGSLSEPTYRDIVALMLKSNGFPAGQSELGRDTGATVQIVQKDGRTELPANALVRVVGCLAKSGTDWVLTSATSPERAERAATVEEDAARTLGKRTMTLKFVVTRLDALAGSRVAVNGLLIGDGGVDGINVTTVSRVAQKCP
jgi:mono/diheme cytochrome c family protein